MFGHPGQKGENLTHRGQRVIGQINGEAFVLQFHESPLGAVADIAIDGGKG